MPGLALSAGINNGRKRVIPKRHAARPQRHHAAGLRQRHADSETARSLRLHCRWRLRERASS